MKAPRLTYPLLLETPQRMADGAGGFLQTWLVLGTVWGAVTAHPGHEAAAGAAAVSHAVHRIILRAAPEGSSMRPRPDQRLRHAARVFTILSVTETDPAGRYLTCTTREEVAR